MATCSLPSLLQSGKCFCGATTDPVRIARLTLLCQILQSKNPVASCNLATLESAGVQFQKVTMDKANIAELELMSQIVVAFGGSALNVETLLSRGKCFCGATTSPYEIVRLQLLCEISAVAH